MSHPIPGHDYGEETRPGGEGHDREEYASPRSKALKKKLKVHSVHHGTRRLYEHHGKMTESSKVKLHKVTSKDKYGERLYKSIKE